MCCCANGRVGGGGGGNIPKYEPTLRVDPGEESLRLPWQELTCDLPNQEFGALPLSYPHPGDADATSLQQI